MISSPVLALPDYTLPFVVETDASAQGVGSVLMQQGKPVAFFSKELSTKHQGLSTYWKELLVIVLAVQKWNSYLQGNRFIIKTDNQSLKFLLEQCLLTLLQQKWLAKLIGLDYEIVTRRVWTTRSHMPYLGCQKTTVVGAYSNLHLHVIHG